MTGQREGHKPGCFNPECPGEPRCFTDFSPKPQRFFNEKSRRMEEKCDKCGATKVGPW